MKISVLIPVFNTPAEHLIEAFMSMVNQTHKPDEIIIINDGSTDFYTIMTIPFLESIGAKTHYLNENTGTGNALNKGHDLCRNDWIAIMGSDDFSFPERLEKQAEYIKQNPASHLCGTGLFACWNDDPYRRTIFSKVHHEKVTDISNKWVCNHSTAMYHKSVLDKVSKFNKDLFRGQDVDF